MRGSQVAGEAGQGLADGGANFDRVVAYSPKKLKHQLSKIRTTVGTTGGGLKVFVRGDNRATGVSADQPLCQVLPSESERRRPSRLDPSHPMLLMNGI